MVVESSHVGAGGDEGLLRAQRTKKLPPTWKYESATASALVS